MRTTTTDLGTLSEGTVADLRSRCAAIERRCATVTSVVIDSGDVTHRNGLCRLIGPGHIRCDAPLFELVGAPLCNACASDLHLETRTLVRILTLFAALDAGPVTSGKLDAAHPGPVQVAESYRSLLRKLEDDYTYGRTPPISPRSPSSSPARGRRGSRPPVLRR